MKTKIISAIVALALVIPAIYVGGYVFYFAAATVGLLGFRELMQLKEKEKDIPFFVKIISLFSFIYIVLFEVEEKTMFFMEYKLVTIAVFLLLIPLVFYQNTKKYNIADALFLLGSIFFLGTAFNYLITIRIIDLNLLIYLLLVTIITDTFAQVTGYLIGRNKLCPEISPKKTVEGLIGGTLLGVFVGTYFYINVFNYSNGIFKIVLITLFLSLMAQLGDLIFSSIKRYYKVKDFSNIMPGHGGILDRLDSVIFVLYAFSFIIELL